MLSTVSKTFEHDQYSIVCTGHHDPCMSLATEAESQLFSEIVNWFASEDFRPIVVAAFEEFP